jgi:mono/diheme cytochrome c family protein
MTHNWIRCLVLFSSWSFAGATLTGCEKLMRNMYDQPRHKPLSTSTLWSDGSSARPIEAGTVVHSGGAVAGASSGRLQIEPLPELLAPDYAARESGEAAPLRQADQKTASLLNPLPITAAVLERGRERFDIYCAPCHSQAGDGDGIIARRGFPRPPSYHTERLRSAPDSHFYAVITQGYGAMYSYADRIATRDRWAIVAYIRALQLSQHAMVADAPPAQRLELRKAKP